LPLFFSHLFEQAVHLSQIDAGRLVAFLFAWAIESSAICFQMATARSG
jgi:hypothetical protein